MSNEAPFFIGQRVVALVDAGYDSIKVISKGQEFNVQALKQCSCGHWKVDVGIALTRNGTQVCFNCKSPVSGDHHWCRAKIFAPVQYNDITAELAKKAVETDEVSDLPVIKEPVTN